MLGPQMNSIYDTGYFDSEEQAQEILKRYVTQGPILYMPEYEVIVDVSRELTDAVYHERLTPKKILEMYNRIRQSHQNTDIWCLLKDEGNPNIICGGKVELGIDAFGAYYYCKKYPSTHIFTYPLPTRNPNP